MKKCSKYEGHEKGECYRKTLGVIDHIDLEIIGVLLFVALLFFIGASANFLFFQ